MAYNFLEESDLHDAIHDSEGWMRPFFEPLPELERLGRGKPGRIPKGKPRVTDGTLAGVRRETPKRIIQQLPTGKVVIKKNPDLAEQISALLTDEILPHANSGGTPYAKSKNAIKDTITTGASAAYVFYNRRGDWFGADFRRVYIKDIGFENGKVSEFDSNYMFMTGWYTKTDIKAIIHYQQKLKRSAEDRKEKYQDQWNLKVLQELLDSGESDKDAEHKSETEKANLEGTHGFFKLVHCFQVGEGATFYTYAPRIKKVAKKCVTEDPRGIIPIHLLVPEEDYSNPLGEALIAISAGKQNLLDFDMQMYQYSQGLQYSPPVKKWGDVPTSAIKLVPDAVIDMGSSKNTGTDFEVVDISNNAQSNFANNYGLIKSQILNELGATSDTSISSTAGNPGFSKTDAGVDALQARLSISDNDLRKSYEGWWGRICGTLVNVHMAGSKGKREIEMEADTMKRLKLDKPPVMDYDQDFGKIKFTVDASSSEAQDSQKENERLVNLLEIKSKYGANPDEKFMRMYNQIVKNAVVDDPEKLMYSDEEIEQILLMQQQAVEAAKQQETAMAQEAAAQEQMMAEQAQMPSVDPGMTMPPAPEMPMSQNALPEEVAQQGMTEDEMQTVEMLQAANYSDEQIADALVMLRNDVADEQLMQILGQPEGGM